jgi:hypothetical protein
MAAPRPSKIASASPKVSRASRLRFARRSAAPITSSVRPHSNVIAPRSFAHQRERREPIRRAVQECRDPRELLFPTDDALGCHRRLCDRKAARCGTPTAPEADTGRRGTGRCQWASSLLME